MSADSVQHVVAGAAGPLDGTWLRHERERIAVGRRRLADQLHVDEGRVAAVELKKLLVPQEWIQGLAELGFRIPKVVPAASAEVKRATERADPAVAQEISQAPAAAPEAALTPAVSSAPTSGAPSPLAIAPPGTDAATPPVPASSADIESGLLHAASRSAAVKVAMPAAPSSQTTATLAPTAQPSDPAQIMQASMLLRGTWLRGRRHELLLSLSRLSKALGCSDGDLCLVEANNLILPASWARPLAALGALDSAQAASQGSSLGGRWLRREREMKGVSARRLSNTLRVRLPALRLVEVQDWPVPPEWLSELHRLGFSLPPALRPAIAGQADASTQGPSKKPAPQTLSLPGRPASPPTGAWLRKQRLQKSIAQQALSKHLKVSPAALCRRERGDRPLPSKWLPILEKLGFSFPSAPLIAAPRSAPHTGAKQIHQAAQHGVLTMHATQVDGKWLRAERERLGHSLNGMSKRLGVAWDTYARVERESLSIPRAWWTPLRRLDFRLPKPEPAASSQRAASAERQPELRGSWLLRERNRLELSLSSVRKKLRIHPTTLTRVERKDLPVPAAWLPALRQLKMNLEGAVAAPVQTAPKAARPQSLAVPPAPAPTGEPSAPSRSSPNGSVELVEMILAYRLKYGRLTGQAPAEILIEIGKELSQAGAGRAISYEAVEQTMKALLQVLLSERNK